MSVFSARRAFLMTSNIGVKALPVQPDSVYYFWILMFGTQSVGMSRSIYAKTE
jgi:hypothetical protein